MNCTLEHFPLSPLLNVCLCGFAYMQRQGYKVMESPTWIKLNRKLQTLSYTMYAHNLLHACRLMYFYLFFVVFLASKRPLNIILKESTFRLWYVSFRSEIFTILFFLTKHKNIFYIVSNI